MSLKSKSCFCLYPKIVFVYRIKKKKNSFNKIIQVREDVGVKKRVVVRLFVLKDTGKEGVFGCPFLCRTPRRVAEEGIVKRT